MSQGRQQRGSPFSGLLVFTVALVAVALVGQAWLGRRAAERARATGMARGQVLEVYSRAHGVLMPAGRHYRHEDRLPTPDDRAFRRLERGFERLREHELVASAALRRDGLWLRFGEADAVVAPLAGRSIVFAPVARGARVRWVCRPGTIDRRYLPINCRASESGSA